MVCFGRVGLVVNEIVVFVRGEDVLLGYGVRKFTYFVYFVLISLQIMKEKNIYCQYNENLVQLSTSRDWRRPEIP